MTVPPKIRLEGPLFYNEDTGETTDYSGAQTGPLDLYTVESARESAETGTQPQSVPGMDDEDTILAPLTGSQSVNYEGTASGMRLYQAGYGDNPREALRNWLVELESLLLPFQGSGYYVQDDVRDKVYNPSQQRGVLLDTVRWTHESGEPMDAEYRVEGEVTDGVQEPERTRGTYFEGQEFLNLSDDTDDRLFFGVAGANVPLGHVEERSYERSVDLNVQEIAYQFDVPNFGLVESGVESEFTLQGRLSEKHLESEGESLTDVAKMLTEDFHGEEVAVRDTLTERWFEGALSTSRTTFNAGEVDQLEYNIEIDISGNVVN